MDLDCISIIGNNYKVCQDYFLQLEDPIPGLIIVDGCGSSQHTDVGARLIAHWIRRNFYLLSRWFRNSKKKKIN
ncbi:MAG: hypothetical protein A3K77_00110 [Euryarchaeota archaeon RBG_13_31_8]|nr:MAG: hypothetical protein A3K77_00110 [Euryarchaeota archaeon RBG_13_31_8]